METMIFSSKEKTVFKNVFIQIEWSAYCICKEQHIINYFKKHGSMDTRPRSGRPQTTTSEDNILKMV